MSELAAEPRMLIDGKLVEAASGATYGLTAWLYVRARRR